MDGRIARSFAAARVAPVIPRSAHFGFDFTSHMRQLCRDMVQRVAHLRHIDIDRVAISYAKARKRVAHGLHAALTPMRFEHGSPTYACNGRQYRVQRLLGSGGEEMLYILSFYLPRFMDVDFHEKLITIFHELWHISPEFNGDLRRHPGRCYVHSHSEEQYDKAMSDLAAQWLARQPDVSLYSFLHLSYDELRSQYGGVYGVRMPHPKLIPIRDD